MRELRNARWLITSVALFLAACGGGGDVDFRSGAPDPDGGGAGGEAEQAALSRLSQLLVVPSSKQLPNDADNPGTEGVILTVIALDSNRNVLAGVPVQLSTTNTSGQGDGVISPLVFGGTALAPTTSEEGTLVANLTTGGDASERNIVVTATAGNIASVPVSIAVVTPDAVSTGDPVANLQLLATSAVLPADADAPDEAIQLTVVTTDARGNTVAGVGIEFVVADTSNNASAGLAAITVLQGQTDQTGRALAALTTGGNDTARSFRVLASVPTDSSIPAQFIEFTVPGTNAELASLDLLASARQIVGSGGDVVTLTAIAKDAGNNALANAPVRFTANRGVLSPGGILVTDDNGLARTTLSAGSLTAPSTITVNLEGVSTAIRQSVVIDVIADTPQPKPEFVSLLAGAPTLGTEADTVAEGLNLTALVRDEAGVLLAGQPVSFSVLSGNAALSVSQGQTDNAGVARAVLTTAGDPTNRDVVVQAIAGARSANISVGIVGTDLTISGPNSVGQGDAATLTVRLVNGAGEGIPNETISLTATGTGANPGLVTLNPASGVTDSSGRLEFEVIGGTDGSTRISADAAPLGLTVPRPQFDVEVAAYSLEFGFPSSDGEIALGSTIPVTVRLQGGGCGSQGIVDAGTCNSNGAPVVRFASTRGRLSVGSAATANAPYIDDAVPLGTLDVADTALDGVATVNLSTSFSDGSGPVTITATGPGGSSDSLTLELVATQPDAVEIQAEPNTVALNSNAQIEVRVRDASENPVKNQRVEFRLEDPTGGSLSATNRITDSLGRAFVTYNSTSLTSAQGGVRVTASLPDSPTVAPATVGMTVSGGALRIILGTGNEVFDHSETTYAMPWSVIVTDSSGNPAPAGTVFRLSYEPMEFRKGFFTCPIRGEPWVRNVIWECPDEDLDNDFILDRIFDEDIDNDGNLDVDEDLNGNGILDLAEMDLDFDGNADVAEDLDGDGRLDVGEDLNGNGVLDPGEDLNRDGLLALTEDLNGNGVFDSIGEDLDRDGHLDRGEDINGNGRLDLAAEDIDGDGRFDLGEDLNADGILNWEDLDYDGNFDLGEDVNGNGRLDPGEDIDGDAFLDRTEDLNNDGVFQTFSEDIDADGVFDTVYEDIDNDCTLSGATEDLDGDGNFDQQDELALFATAILTRDSLRADLDADRRVDRGEDRNLNGILDAGEDIDGDGVLDLTEDLNNDGVFQPSEDTNGNGLLDAGEDTNGNGILDRIEDIDGDGRFDNVDEFQRFTESSADVDFDRRLDRGEDTNYNGRLDPGEDRDNDGRLDLTEDLNEDGAFSLVEDLDGDGKLDVGEDTNCNGRLDVGEDIDGDGILDRTEDFDGDGVFRTYSEDIDGDGNFDNVNEDTNGDLRFDREEDVDGDGVLDINEDLNGNGVFDLPLEDIDGDGNFDIGEDLNANGRLDPGEDRDGDGVLDRNEDLDGDGIFNRFGEDVDNDGVLDLTEDLNGDGVFQPTEDLNGNGRLDPGEDLDGDGVLDAPFEDIDQDGRFDRFNEDSNGNLRLDPSEDLDNDGRFDDVNEDVDGDGRLDELEDLNGNGVLDEGEDVDGDGRLDTVDEDQLFAGNPNVDQSIVGNGRLDVAEDTNQDGVLTPGNIATLPATIELDENGYGQFEMIYAEQYAGWVSVRLRAVATVGGTETTAIQTFTLSGIASDFTNCPDTSPPGSPSPFGFLERTCLNDQ